MNQLVIQVFPNVIAPSRTFGFIRKDGELAQKMDLAELAMFFGELHRAQMALENCADFMRQNDGDA